MKQQITWKDLNQLSEKGFDKYDRWILDHDDYIEIVYHNGMKIGLMTIGQMIEFLDENTGEDIYDSSYHHTCWERHIGRPQDHQFTIFWEKDKELCDALWQAVKGVLENE